MMSCDLESQGRDPNIFGARISKTDGDTDSVTVEHLYEMAPEVSKWPRDPVRSRSWLTYIWIQISL